MDTVNYVTILIRITFLFFASATVSINLKNWVHPLSGVRLQELLVLLFFHLQLVCASVQDVVSHPVEWWGLFHLLLLASVERLDDG